jgi:hypothetical protein
MENKYYLIYKEVMGDFCIKEYKNLQEAIRRTTLPYFKNVDWIIVKHEGGKYKMLRRGNISLDKNIFAKTFDSAFALFLTIIIFVILMIIIIMIL